MAIKYHKITVRSTKDVYLVVREKGKGVGWTSNDGNATGFDSVEDALLYIKDNLKHRDRYRFHVTAFYRDRQGFLAWHYIYLPE